MFELALIMAILLGLAIPAFGYLKEELEGADGGVASIIWILCLCAPIISIPILLICALRDGYFTSEPEVTVTPLPLPDNVVPIRRHS
jgi:hypothetical protein